MLNRDIQALNASLQQLGDQADVLVAKYPDSKTEIHDRLAQLKNAWESLETAAAARNTALMDSRRFYRLDEVSF